MAMLHKLGWDGDLTPDETCRIDAVAGEKTNWKTDLSGGIQRVAIKHGCAPVRQRQGPAVVWTFPDPVPLHREPLYTPRRDLLDKYAPTKTRSSTVFRPPMRRSRRTISPRTSRSFSHPAVWSNMRAVATRPGPTRGWPSCSRTCSSRSIRRCQRSRHSRRRAGLGHGPEGGKVKVMAMITDRVGRGVAFMPFHFGGHFEGRTCATNIRRALIPMSWRVVEHGADLRLRLGHPDAGNQSHALPNRAGVREEIYG